MGIMKHVPPMKKQRHVVQKDHEKTSQNDDRQKFIHPLVPKKVEEYVVVSDKRKTKRNLKTKNQREQRKRVTKILEEESCQLRLELVLQKKRFLVKAIEQLD